jgi:predicted RecA/RadA family phage recombinase
VLVHTINDSDSTWTARSAAEANSWQSITFGNNLFVAASNDGTNRIMTSHDGVLWETNINTISQSWSTMVHGNNLFIIIGTSRALRMTDTLGLSTHLTGSNGPWKGAAYGKALFVSVGEDASAPVMTSPDGTLWTARFGMSTNDWQSVVFGNGIFVAVSNTGTGDRVMTSSDGITWTSRTSAADNDWTSVTFGNSLFVAVAETGTGDRVMTSSDGITWTSRTSAADNSWTSVVFGNSLFVAVSSDGTNRVMTSSDGVTWALDSAAEANSWTSATYGNGLFVAVSSDGTNRVMTSLSTGTHSTIKENKTAIASQGDFESTILYSELSNSEDGRFSDAPIETIGYCNSKVSAMWGGDELTIGRFINFDPAGSFEYDYTDKVSNQSQNDTALLKRVSATINSNTMLMLHCDGGQGGVTFTDSSPTTPHTVTTNGNTHTDTVTKKLGTAAAKFDGTGDYLSIPDNADFDLSGGTWSIDFWIYPTTLAASTDYSIYEHATDASNYMVVILKTSTTVGEAGIQLDIVSGGSSVVTVTSALSLIKLNTFHHVAINENGNTYQIFIDGLEVANVSDANRAANYTGSITIGEFQTATGSGFIGFLDEFRIQNASTFTVNFNPATEAYTTSTVTTTYLGSLLPAKSFKFYVKTANATAATGNIQENTASGFANTNNQSDGTASGGVSLAQTGSITFSDTKDTTKISIINGLQMYWYKIVFTGIDQDTEIYWITVGTAVQSAKDIWDGEAREVLSFKHFDDNSVFQDYTINVFKNEYDPNISSTFAPSFTGTTSSEAVYCGFSQRQMALNISFSVGDTQTTTSALSVKYWNGTAWTAVDNLVDNTQTAGATWSKSGVVSWIPPTETSEFKTQVQNELPFYYYKLEFSATLSATNIRPYYISGIPAPIEIKPTRFPLEAHNRLWYCNEVDGKKNKVIQSARGTYAVFNGDDTTELLIGDDKGLTAGAELYGQFNSNLYHLTLFTKIDETWLVSGDSPLDWTIFPLSKTVGCPAPLTMTVFNIATTQGEKVVAVWQGSNGIWMTDGRSLTRLDNDIKNVFDPNSSGTKINTSRIDKSTAFYDENLEEWHWLWSSGANTTHDQEYVLDVRKSKWYTMSRGTGSLLQMGIPVEDTTGNTFVYGGIDTGYLERLDNGTTFHKDGDTNDIVSKFRLGDNTLAGLMKKTSIRYIKMPMRTKTNTSNSVVGTHYGDVSTSASADTFTMSPTKSGRNVTSPTQGTNLREFIYHSLEMSMTTDDETVGFEPIAISIIYIIIRDDTKGD